MRTARAKVMAQQRKWTKLSLGARKQLVQCPCGGGEQTPHHMWMECPIAQPILHAALSRPNTPDWNAVPITDRLTTVLSPSKLVDLEGLRKFKLSLIIDWVAAIKTLEGAMGVTKKAFEQEFRERFLEEQVPEQCQN